MNTHTPERQAGESFDDYRARRAASRAAVRGMTCAGIGNQRNKPSARETLRDEQRKNGRGPSGVYGIGLLQPQRKRNQQRMAQKIVMHDAHGCYTYVGKPPRIWLAGISAQRGY